MISKAKKTLNITGCIFILFVFAILIEWMIFNAILGCKTWDESKWTNENSCLSIVHLIE